MYFIDIKTLSLTIVGTRPYECLMIGIISMVDITMYFIDAKTLSLALIGEKPYKCMMIGIISSMLDYQCIL